MVALPFRQLLLKFLLYQLHKTIGITAFVLALGQLALHWRRGRPAWVEDCRTGNGGPRPPSTRSCSACFA